jgi:hypothetical protein
VRDHRQRPVVVAVIAVRMMQAPVHEVVDMVAVRHGFVAAVRAVFMTSFMTTCVVFWIASVGIVLANRDHMLMCAAFFGMFEPAVIKVIDMIIVLHSEVAAAWAVDMR